MIRLLFGYDIICVEVIMAGERSGGAVSFVEQNFVIHGEFEGKVYRTKRNGEQEVYPYEPVSFYERTPLVIRNEWIRRYAGRYSNPREADYPSIIRKLNYYTPYILPVGRQSLQGETVFYVRERGDYEFRWSGTPLGFNRTVARRTDVELSFHTEGEYSLECYYDGELYCVRNFVITSEDLDERYESWLEANIEVVLGQIEPGYARIKTYRRGLRSRRVWITGISGKCHQDVIYEHPDYSDIEDSRASPWLYHRRVYDHSTNPQTVYFNGLMQQVSAGWQLLSDLERAEWSRRAMQQYPRGRISGFNLFTRDFYGVK
jgi:hypothetical protein